MQFYGNHPQHTGVRHADHLPPADPPGCALTDKELDLLRRVAAANAPVIFQAEGRTTCAYLAFDHRVDVLRDLRKADWIVLEVWVSEPGNRGHARRRFSAAQAYCTESRTRGAGAHWRLVRWRTEFPSRRSPY
jgi:hypothetical protein